ncbi:MAG: hypothetical protein HDT21_10385 [Ruminococcus sp.]|nr:hypothetical protein [Ruminococcus sp.]
MKCEIIKDLLPAYCDCVCSLETAAEIEQHTANCENCKKLLEDYRSEIEPLNKTEPEKPFRKIKRKIFRSKSAVISLIILLVIVLSAVGYLTYGQIVRTDYPSFETIISSQKAKKLVKKFCEGDIDYVMENIEIYQPGFIRSTGFEDVRKHCRSALTDFYEKYFKGKNLQVKIDGYCGYDSFQYETGQIPLTELGITDGNTTILEFSIIEHHGGKFYLYLIGCNTAVNETDIDTVNLALIPIEPTAILDAAIINYKPERESNFSLFASRFSQTPEEKQAIIENTTALMEDMYCEKAFYTEFRFDKENNRYLVDIGYIFIETSSGKRVMYTRTVQMKSAFYNFDVLPEFEPVIIDDGISAENLEKLKNLFVY